MYAAIKAIEYYLPKDILTNEQLAREFPDWPADKIKAKLGIVKRHICDENECASDLGVCAAEKLFAHGVCNPSDIDFILFCTQSPDYFLPTTACTLQKRLGVSKLSGALDFNLGHSGFVYGLSLARGLIESGQAKNILLITAETYSKYLDQKDKTTRTLFGDGAAATLVQVAEHHGIGPTVFGTDSEGADSLVVKGGGMRDPQRSRLYMNGPEIFAFTLKIIPEAVKQLLDKANKSLDDMDLFVFHQANKYMLESLRDKIGIPSEKFCISMEDCGNTVSASIPIALKDAKDAGLLKEGQLVMLVGFGVGYSWAASIIKNRM